MATMNIYKGERLSEGAINLRNKLHELGNRSVILRAEGSTYRGREGHFVINWGTITPGSLALLGEARLLNPPSGVSVASNKRSALRVLADNNVPIVPYFEELQAALTYVADSGGRIYARTDLRGHSGAGIHLLIREDDPQRNNEALQGVTFPVSVIGVDPLGQAIHQCQLFTIGHIGKRVEWRAHVVNGEVILLQKKLRRQQDGEDGANANTLVRNASTGWVYSVNYNRHEEDQRVIEGLETVAITAVAALNLNFGAVDLIVDNATKIPRVLEVNTAPGLEGETTIQSYAEAFHKLAGGVL